MAKLSKQAKAIQDANSKGLTTILFDSKVASRNAKINSKQRRQSVLAEIKQSNLTQSTTGVKVVDGRIVAK
jgi:hypothetical protein